jgi:hypothetical protein
VKNSGYWNHPNRNAFGSCAPAKTGQHADCGKGTVVYTSLNKQTTWRQTKMLFPGCFDMYENRSEAAAKTYSTSFDPISELTF